MPEELRPVILALTRRPRELAKVLLYRNERVVRTFLRQVEIPRSEADSILEDLLRWLWLCRVHELDPAARTKDRDFPRELPLYARMTIVDEMWHAFLLCSRDYAEFCRGHLGALVHHRPNVDDDGPDSEPDEDRRTVAYICRRLGPDVARRWFVEYPKRYAAFAKGA